MLLGDADQRTVEERHPGDGVLVRHFGVVARFFEAGNGFLEADRRVDGFEADEGLAEEGLSNLLEDAVADCGVFGLDGCDDSLGNILIDLREEGLAGLGEAEQVPGAPRAAAFKVERGETLVDERLHMLAGGAD